MSIAAFLGFLIGAAIGAVATSTTGPELRKEAERWISDARWRVYLRGKTWRFPALLSEVLNLVQIEILLILVFLWLMGLLGAIYLSPTWSDQTYIRYIVGSLVGTAAAPWIWLHFSQSFEAAKTEGEAAAESSQLARYRFVTFMLGAALLVAILNPYLATWLKRTNKIEGFGVALSFIQPRNERGSNILQAGQQTTAALGATSSRLASATSRAHLVATGHQKEKPGAIRKTLKDVTANMDGFSDLSVMDRDKVYIAYFNHERNARYSQVTPGPNFSNLQEYVEAAKPTIDQAPDDKYLADLADLSECIALYAEHLRDFRLFLVDSNALVGALLVDVATKWREKDPAQPASANQQAASAAKLNLTLYEAFAKQVVDALQKSKVLQELRKSDPRIPADLCADAKKLTNRTVELKDIGKTPYPAYQIAHYLAAIDSVDSGVLVLKDWLSRQSSQARAGIIQNDPEQGWYAVRAMLTSSQLPDRFGSVSPTHRALVKFQQETTTRMAALLSVGDGRSWRSFCNQLKDRGLHAQIGRYLAMTYADERNYLFELLRPEDFGLPPPGEDALKSTGLSPATYLEEAEAILEAPECFRGVPRFDPKLIDLYHLNAAQLRYSLRMLKEGDEKLALTRQIRADLEQAKQLGSERDAKQLCSEPEGVPDLLCQPDEFEPHRARLAEFRKTLDNEGEKD
jgi:hypothetical protein